MNIYFFSFWEVHYSVSKQDWHMHRLGLSGPPILRWPTQEAGKERRTMETCFHVPAGQQSQHLMLVGLVGPSKEAGVPSDSSL